jgi:hypothetical protein
MIIVSELYREGEEHVPINASLLCMLSKIYSDQPVVFWSSTSHSNAVQRFIESKGISLQNVTFQQVASLHIGLPISSYMKKVMCEILNVKRLHSTIRHLQPAQVFYLSISPFTSCVFHKFIYDNSYRARIVLHGDLEFIRLNTTRLRNYLGRCLRMAFRSASKNLSYIVLDHLIKKNLVKTGLINAGRIISLPHPYIFNDHFLNYNDENAPVIPPVHIGMIGVASMEKNSQLLFGLADRLRNECLSGKVIFTIIGKNENISDAYQNEYVEIVGKEGMVTRPVFEQQIGSIHFSIFFYSNEAYQLSSSGALLDAIEFEKPLIALRNDLFESIFSEAGEIGYLCNSVDEMYDLIIRFSGGNMDIDRYNSMKGNMRKYKSNTTLDILSKQLASELN